MREGLNAIRYMARSGGGWRMLPKDFPPWQTVYWWFQRFVRLQCRGQLILETLRWRWPWLKHLFADGVCDRTRLMDEAAFLDFVIEVVRRLDDAPGFKVVPRRWVVERTFAWLPRWRRLVRNYEQRLDVSGAMIHVAMGSLPLQRICHRSPFSNRH